MPLSQGAKQVTMPESTLCACAWGKMHNDARIDTNFLWIGEITASRIHPYIPTDSHCFGNFNMMISFIHNFWNICHIRLRFSGLLDRNSVSIVHKWELSTCVTFYSALVFSKFAARVTDSTGLTLLLFVIV